MIKTINLKDINEPIEFEVETIATKKPEGAIKSDTLTISDFGNELERKEEIGYTTEFEIEENKKVVVESNEDYSHSSYEGIPKEWYGDVWIITSGEFMALLTGQEYALYCGLNTIKYHNAQKDKPVNYLWENQLKYSYLAEELQLYGGKNKAGEDATVSRQTIGRLVNSLISKGVLTRKKILSEEHEVIQYILVSAKGELFTKIEKPLLEVLTRTLKGQVIKTYAYIKAMYEVSIKNGNKELNISRSTIAKAINEVSKKGAIGERQLKNISMYLSVLYNLNLVKASVLGKENINGIYSKLIRVEKVNTSLKDIPIVKSKKKAS